MSDNEPSPISHDINEIGKRVPDLGISSPMDEAALKELEAKYKLRLQIADQVLRERELRLKEQTAQIDRWANPLTVGVIVGALGLFGNFVNGLWSNLNQRAQLENERTAEQIKLQNDLIKEAIKPADEQERAKSLVFFARNGLIDLDSATLSSLVAIAGTEQPVPGSSAGTGAGTSSSAPLPVAFSQTIVDRILQNPGVPYPAGIPALPQTSDGRIRAIILHATLGPNSAVSILRTGRYGLQGPLAHWAVQTDGSIEFIAEESRRANHVGRATGGLSNANTIGIEASGLPAFGDERQVENLVRLVADVADRWNVPTSMILSHAEVADPPGSRTDMRDQAPAIRQMVDAVRAKP